MDPSIGRLTRFEMVRRNAGLVGGPFLALLLFSLPLSGLSSQAHALSVVVALAVTFWLTEALPLPVTALLAVALAIVLGVAPAGKALSAFGDHVIFLFIGSFMIARAMQIHGVDRRIAYALLAHPWVGGNARRTLWAIGLAAWLLSMWLSNTATVAMLLPVVLALARAAAEERTTLPAGNDPLVPGRRYATGLLLLLAYAASVGGIATPVGTPPNLIGIALIDQGVGIRIGFLQWMAFGLPIALVLLLAAFIIIVVLFPPPMRQIPGQAAQMRRKLQEMGPWTLGQRNCLIAFGAAVILWITPGFLGLVLGSRHPISELLHQRIPEAAAALLSAGLLFLLPTDWKRREFTLGWEEAVRIDWGTVLLFGGGIALGKMMLDTGLASAMGTGLLKGLGVQSQAALAGAATFTATFISETASNTASANMVVPMMLSVAEASGMPGAALGVAATLGASLGFMFPVSTPPNAIVYGSGAIRITDMVRAGILLDLAGGLIVWAAAVFWVPRIL